MILERDVVNLKIKDKIISRLGDNVNTDVIFPARYLVLFDKEEVKKHVFEDIDPKFAEKIKGGGVVLAGENFGCGSAREQGLTALKYAGVSMIICKSFSRAFYRNGINNGVPLFIADCNENIFEIFNEGDEAEADFITGELKNITKGITLKCTPTDTFIINVLNHGGISEYLHI